MRDQRDIAVGKISELIDIRTFEDTTGKIAVFTGAGRTLISEGTVFTLTHTAAAQTDANVAYIRPGDAGYPGPIGGIFVGTPDLTNGTNDITTQILDGEIKGLIDIRDIVIDAKSGISGAGRAAREASLFAEVSEGVHAYGLGGHRHAPEIEQEIARAAGAAVAVAFTPHLMPMNRGLLSTIHVRLADGATAADLRVRLAQHYDGEPFVRVVGENEAPPATRHVRGSNRCLIGVYPDRIAGRARLISVIDNLVKGAAGQAIQNLNVARGFDETAGLDQAPLFP